jgi:hypothetical protein
LLVASVVATCGIGLGCASPGPEAGAQGAVAVPDEPSGDGASESAPPIVPHRGHVPSPPKTVEHALADIEDLIGSSGGQVMSVARGPDGAVYAAGTFDGTIVVGEIVLRSRGLEDVFVVRTEADGRIAWARSAGSELRERGPRVTLDTDDDGRVKVVGTSDGQMNCGDGPMSWWAGTATIFLCVFDGPTGANVSGGAFPIAP